MKSLIIETKFNYKASRPYFEMWGWKKDKTEGVYYGKGITSEEALRMLWGKAFKRGGYESK